jgi:zinc protease
LEPYVNSVDTTNNKKLLSKANNPGRVTKQAENRDLGSTEWILSNGVRVILKKTSFKKDEIYFGGFRSLDTAKLKKEYLVLLKEPYSIKRTGVANFSATQINQMLANKRVEMYYVYSVQKQGIQGSFSSQDFETALQLINMSFSDQSWISNDTIKSLPIMTTGLDNLSSNTFHDSILKYSDNTRFRDLKVVPLERLNKVFKNIFNNPQKFTFIFSGDFKAEEAKPLVEKYLGSLTFNTEKVIKSEMSDHQDKILETNHEWWQTGKKNCEFTYPMNISRTLVFLRCQGKFNVSPVNSIYCDIAQKLLRDRIQTLIREKYNATYSVGQGMNLVNPDFAQLSVTFIVEPSKADQMKAIAIEEFQKFMEEGAGEVEFNIQKDKVVKQQSSKLSSNEWWVNSALFDFYFHHKNIVPAYVKEASNISLEGLKEFTRSIYRQGNIVNIIMKSQ